MFFKLSQKHHTLEDVSPDNIERKGNQLTSTPDSNMFKMPSTHPNLKTKFKEEIELETSNALAYIIQN